MRRLFFLILTLFVISSPVFGQAPPSLMIDHVDGLTSPGTLPTETVITFHIRLTNNFGTAIIGSTNGFQVYSPDGAVWDTTINSSTAAIADSMYDAGEFLNQFSTDGQGADTVGFGGFSLFGTGIPDGFSEIVWEIQIGPIDASYAGKEICVDSSFYPPASAWKWSSAVGDKDPSWGGPYCYTIESDSIVINQPPVLTSIGSQDALVGTPLFINVTATDPDGTIPALSADPIPAGAYFVDSGYGYGQFAWVPTINQVGTNYVTFFATDEHNAVDSEVVAISVSAQGGGVSSISLMAIHGMIGDNMIPAGQEVELIYKATNNTGFLIRGMTHGLIIHSPDGAQWGATGGRTTDNTSPLFDLYNDVNLIDVDGQFTDSLIYGYVSLNSGLAPGFNDSIFAITLGPVSADQAGKTICIDTSFMPPAGLWAWSDPTGQLMYPGWNGQRCFTITAIDSMNGGLTWINPSEAYLGDSLWITFYGEGTQFTMGTPEFSLEYSGMLGIYVKIDPQATNIINDTIASCLFVFSPYTVAGEYSAVYTNTFESGLLPNVFNLLSGGSDTPEISWVHPNHGQRGDTIRVQIGVHNYDLTTTDDSLRVQFLRGFSVFTPLEMIIYDDTSMGVLIAIPPLATPGMYDLRISDGMLPDLYKTEAFRVDGEDSCIISVLPSTVHLTVSDGIPRDSMIVTVLSNCWGAPYHVSSNADWLTGVPWLGMAYDSMWVVGDGTGLTTGTHESTLQVWINSSWVTTVSVILHVEGDTVGTGRFLLDHVDGLVPGTAQLALNMPITFHLRLQNYTGHQIVGLTNGWRVYSPDGATWGGTSLDTTGAITYEMMENLFLNSFSADGMGADTVGFGGFRLLKPGIPIGFDDIPYRIQLDGFGSDDVGKTVCLDSSFYRPSGIWKWSLVGSSLFPQWSGPHCFQIGDTLYNQCDLDLSTDYLEFSASPNQGNPPCQVFRTGTNCPTYAMTNSTWISVYPYMDTTIIHSLTHGLDTVLQPAYKVCTDISMLTPGHRYHDTVLVFPADSMSMPETVFVDLRIGEVGVICNQPFTASVIAWTDFEFPDSGAIFGIAGNATDGYDQGFDLFHFGWTRVYFPHEEYGLLYDNLSADFRSPIDNGCKSWRISVDAQHTGSLHLGMSMLNLPLIDSYDFRLVSDSGHMLVEDFATQSYTFNAILGQTYSFEIIVCCNSSDCRPTHFTNVVETGKSYTYVIPHMSGCFGMSRGDEIGLFDKQTGLLVGSAVYCGEQFPMSIPAWQADQSHGLPGFVEGNDLEVRIYRKEMNQIFCTDLYGQCLPFNSCSYGVIDSIGCVDCGDQFCADFPLASGRWQLVSVPVAPITAMSTEVARCDVDMYFGDVTGLEIIKDDQGNAYIPAYGVDDIGCVSYCEGYNLFRNGPADSLCFDGFPLFGPSCLVQANRWNMISYPLTCPRPVEWVLGSILNCIDIVMDDAGRVYIPGPRGVNTIGDMIPGKGYYLFLSCEADLMIDFPNCFMDSMPTFKDAIAYQSVASGEVSHYQYTNTGLPFAVVLRDIDEAVSPGDEIALFDGAVCVGAVTYNGEKTVVVPAWKGDAEHNLPGYTNGNLVEVRVHRTDGSEDILVESSASIQFGNSNYQAISVGKDNGLPQAYQLDQNYPNPFNPETNISFSLPYSSHVQIDVFNMLGRKVNTIVDADYDAGSFEVKWNGTDYNGRSVSTGVYLYRITADNFTKTKKMLLMK